MIVSSGSSRNSTPSGAVISDRCIVAAISMCETSTVTFSGMSVGSASMLSSRVTCSSTPPSLTPGASSTPMISTDSVVSIFSSRRTSSRSMCMTSSAHRVELLILDDHRDGVGAPTLTSNSAAPRVEHLAQLAGVDLEGHRVAVAAAVEDAGHGARLAQAACLARAALAALVELE